MTFIKDLNSDEIRDGFLVPSDRKKVWNRLIELRQEVDRICRKHEINYWATDARHGGFIPWNVDMKLCMMRPDFNRFCAIVADEITGEMFEVGRKNFFYLPVYHSQTTLLRTTDLTDMREPQGLIIEIIPLDIVSDGTRTSSVAVNGFNELFGAVYSFSELVDYMKIGKPLIHDWALIEQLHSMDNPDEQAEFLAVFAERIFDYSSAVNPMVKFIKDKNVLPYQKSWFRGTIYLPFESIELPAPVGYEELLTACYGNWHKPILNKSNKLDSICSSDIPYREYAELVNIKMALGIPDDKEDH